MFFPGETITHNFIVPFPLSEIHTVVVSYKQKDHIVFEKTITSEDIVSEGAQLSKAIVSFTQAESLSFNDNMSYTVQLNVCTKGGTRHVSQEMKGSSGIQYLREVIPNE